MNITNKPQHDPVADLGMPDAYMRWALLAAEEVTGKQGLSVVLREVGLERLVDNYPPNEMALTAELTSVDYATLFAGLYNFYGRAGKSMLLRIGRLSTQRAIEEQGNLYNVAALAALKLLPLATQLKMGLETAQNSYRKIWASLGYEMHLHLEDRGSHFVWVGESCPMCAGKQADGPICLSFTGLLLESSKWLTGKDFDIKETECRAMGAPACVWEISKTPM